jgi:Holliday junction DNA helicase RuvB
LEFYSEEEIRQIVERSAKLLGIEIDEGGIREISKRSRFTPRTANYFLKRCRDYAQVNKSILNKDTAKKALHLLEVDDLGLTSSDRQILEIIIKNYRGGPVGLGTIATSLSEEDATIEEVNEPYLIQIGMLERTPRGRMVTPKAFEHLGFDMPPLR